MTGSIFVSANKRQTLKKVFAGFMALSLNLSLGGVATLLTSNVAYANTSQSPVYGIAGSASLSGTILTVSGTSFATNETGNDINQHMAVDWDDDKDALTTVWEAAPLGGLTFTPTFASGGFTATWNGTHNYLAAGAGTHKVRVMVYHGNTTGHDGSASTDTLNFNVNIPVLNTLVVSKAGSGFGTVTSVPAGISCGSTCTASYTSGTAVTLTATPTTGSTFAAWSGACTGTGACSVTMTAAKSVTATFADTLAPDTSITSGPSGTVNTNSATFTFTSTEAGTFSCSLDGAASVSCTSPRAYSSLSNGSHTFSVFATDAAGNTDASPATRTWTVDTLPPTVSISSPLGGATTGANGTVLYSVGDAVTVTCTLDGTPVACTTGGTYVFSTLSTGSHTFAITATDAAGNAASTHVTWTVDATGPTVAINSHPTNPSTSSTGTFTFSSNETPTTFTCIMDANSPTACVSGLSYLGLIDGTHNFRVSGMDQFGNIGSVTSFSWLIAVDKTLTMVPAGTGSGSVTSNPSGISCGVICARSFGNGTSVTLTATPATGSTFTGWSGECTGTGACTVTMTSAKTVTATFALIPVQVCGEGMTGIFPNCAPIFIPCPTGSIGVFPACVTLPVDVCPNDAGVQTSLTQCTPADPVCTGGQVLVNHACVTPAPVCNPNVNLLQNASFEAPALSNGSWEIVPFTNAALKWLGAFVNPTNTDNLGLEIQNHVAGTPADGAQYAELDGYHPTAIYQNVPTIAGYDYILNFKYSPRPSTVLGNNVLEVRKDGTVLGAQISRGSTSGDTEWSNESRTFQATGASTEVKFADVSATDDSLGTYIDAASLTCVGRHIPTVIPKGHLVIKKITNGGDATFNFSVLGNESSMSKNVSTDGGTGQTESSIDLTPDTNYTVTELPKSGWNFNSVSCVYDGGSVGETTQNPASHIVNVEAGDTVTCTYTNTKIEVPACIVSPLSVDRTSNTAVLVGSTDGTPAVLVDFDLITPGEQVHPEWTASIPGAQWIWGENPVATPQVDQVEAFFQTVTVSGTPTGATLDIAADNTYEVYLNNVKVGESLGGLNGLDWNNFQLATQDSITIPSTNFVTGSNVLEIRVRNVGVVESNGLSNPAGLLYKMHVTYNTVCEQPPVDMCTNIAGTQSSVPEGMTASEGICTQNPTHNSPPSGGGGGGGGGGGSSTFDYWGCVNPAATNYNPLANKNDGSCQVPGENHNNGAGGGNGNGNGNGGGEVLGAATTTAELPLPASCAAKPYLRDYLKLGRQNDIDQVKLLQSFLNSEMSANIPVSGIFGSMTKAWVKKFQKAHNAEIIQPWIDAGFSHNGLKDGTGYVYKTTKRAINMMRCNAINEPMPALTPDTN